VVSLTRRRVLEAAGAAALMAAPGSASGAGSSIYERIWSEDQNVAGVPPVLPDEPRDRADGYVLVDEAAGADPDHRLFPEVVIPERKRPTYELAKALFDNYRVRQRDGEEADRVEAGETLELLEAVAGSRPMAVAREEIARATGRRIGDDELQEILFEVWFRPFDIGRNRDLTGFEHVVVGEANGEAVSGHHFWYRYYLADGILGDDRIDWRGTRYDGPGGRSGRLTPLGRQVPAVVTLAYRWHTEAGSLLQEIGGFFVGCSPEGLLALGTARFFDRRRGEMAIGNARIEIVLHRSPDGRSVRTFYPRFVGLA
jgi:poly(U)-specific endoribonuclease